MKRPRIALWVVIVLIAGCQTAQPAPAEPPSIIIASDFPLSDTAAPYIRSMSQAVQLEIAKNNHIGRYKVVYEPFDDAPVITAPVRGVQNVRQMIAEGRVLGYVGPATSNGAFAQIQLANSAGLAMVNPSSTNWCLTLPDPYCNPQPAELRALENNFFRVVAPDPAQGRALARFARSVLKVRRAAAYTVHDAVDYLTFKGFKEEFEKDGGQVVWSDDLAVDTKSFIPFLESAQAHGADVIFGATESVDCRIRAQMKKIFPPGTYFLGMDNFQEDTKCIGNAGDNADGMFATVSVADLAQSSDPAVHQFVQDYARAYPHDAAMSPYAFAAYDCAVILTQAITQAVAQDSGGFPTPLQVVRQIAASQFHGLAGTYSFDKNGDATSPLMALYEVKGGQWVYLGQIDAGSTAPPSSPSLG